VNHNLPPHRLLAIAITSVVLTACGSSDDNSSSSDTEHSHSDTTNQRLLISEAGSTSLSLYDRDTASLAIIGQAAAAGTRVLVADNGRSAAVISSTGVQFVDSGLAGLEGSANSDGQLMDTLEVTLANPSVLMTANHFALLHDGVTELYPADALADAVGPETSLALVDIIQNFPALILDEEHELYAFFHDDLLEIREQNAVIKSINCTAPESAIQNGALTLVQCEEGVHSLVLQEDSSTGDATVYTGSALSDISINGWQTGGDYVMAWNNREVNLVYPHNGHTHTSTPDIALDDGMSLCAAAINLDASALLLVRDDASVRVLDLTGTLTTANMTLTEAVATFSCDDIHLDSGGSAFMLVDNSSGHLYTIDSHDGGAYHIHGSPAALSAGTDVRSIGFMESTNSTEHSH
jgi:hypothetical protein